MKYRNTINNLNKIDEILITIENSERMQSEWYNYISQNEYVGDVDFFETVHAIRSILVLAKKIKNS